MSLSENLKELFWSEIKLCTYIE